MTSFRKLNQPTGRIIHLDHSSFLFFGGTAYLGLLQNPDYIELYKDGIDKYGLNIGTSRSNNVQLGIYEESEQELSKRFGFPASALFSSGYLAAQATVRALAKNRKVIYAPDTHPSLWLDQNPNQVIKFEDWLESTIQTINEATEKEFLVISNCMDNLTPRLYDFSAFNKVDSSKNVILVLDDSHGIAVLRKNATSFDKNLIRQPNVRVLILASLAKGLGTDAGLVLGDEELIDTVKEDPIFMGASPCSPAALYALKNGTAIYGFAFDQMQRNTQQMADLVTNLKLNHIPNFPVFTSTEPTLYKHLVNHKIVISSFPYPLPNSPLLNRIVVSALHRPADIEWIAELLSRENILKL
ncbi:aminotransferase class I/II-fold pyridoxal phosphate-dependent enzyme [Sphingobacterium lactis]|uniref:aminotransferase class I/II-fold pyridoxal phosphate-dependent enzyme n=1 Tax=Sphingobacterium lactis TaxID=797291 RepID=UPI003F7F0B4D